MSDDETIARALRAALATLLPAVVRYNEVRFAVVRCEPTTDMVSGIVRGMTEILLRLRTGIAATDIFERVDRRVGLFYEPRLGVRGRSTDPAVGIAGPERAPDPAREAPLSEEWFRLTPRGRFHVVAHWILDADGSAYGGRVAFRVSRRPAAGSAGSVGSAGSADGRRGGDAPPSRVCWKWWIPIFAARPRQDDGVRRIRRGPGGGADGTYPETSDARSSPIIPAPHLRSDLDHAAVRRLRAVAVADGYPPFVVGRLLPRHTTRTAILYDPVDLGIAGLAVWSGADAVAADGAASRHHRSPRVPPTRVLWTTRWRSDGRRFGAAAAAAERALRAGSGFPPRGRTRLSAVGAWSSRHRRVLDDAAAPPPE